MNDSKFKKLNQNNTNSPLRILNFLNKIKKDPNEFLLYHQLLVNKYFIDFPHTRGLLIYHEVGYGKTILASSLATYFAKKNRKVIILAAKSLQDNFKEGLKTFINKSKINNINSELFKYVSLNANNLLYQLSNIDQTKDAKKFEESLSKIIGEKINKTKKNAFDNCLVIIDEAHNLSNGVANGSKNAIGLYDMILKAQNLKLLLLTGTPIINDAFEIGILFNMVKGYIYHGYERTVLFPEIRVEFEQYFIDYKNMKIKNINKFINRCYGLCSYYGNIYTKSEKKTEKNINLNKKKKNNKKKITIEREGFPIEYALKIEYVPMSEEQFIKYDVARDKEKKESVGYRTDNYERFSKRSGSTTYRIATRQISNYFIPTYALGPIQDNKFREKFINRIKKEDLYNLDKYSPKFKRILKNINKHKGISVVYSEFVSGEGINLFAKVLDVYNYEEWKLINKKTGGFLLSDHDDNSQKSRENNNNYNNITINDYKINNLDEEQEQEQEEQEQQINGSQESISKNYVNDSVFFGGGGKNKYVKLTGEINTEDRVEILKYFNNSKNKNGELIKILLLSGAGSEGISIFNARSIHIMNPYWNMAKINQVKARVIRYLSHESLPEKERNVQPYIYLSIYPENYEKNFKKNQDEKVSKGIKREILEKTTDIQLFYKSIIQKKLNDYFLAACIRSSIDCSVYTKSLPTLERKKINCIMCAPNDKQLYHPLISMQFKLDNPCIKYTKEKIKVKEIKIDLDDIEETYYYTDNDDINIYIYDNNLNGYIEMNPDHKFYSKLYNILEKKSRKK